MAYYDALAAQWATLPGGDTTAQKLTAINGMTVPGPNVSVPVSAVVGYLALNGKLSGLQAYAASPPSGAGAQVIVAAKELVALMASPNAPAFNLGVPAVLGAVTAFLDALASDTNTGIVAADVTALLALGATTILWWQSAGYTSPIGVSDLAAAGGLS